MRGTVAGMCAGDRLVAVAGFGAARYRAVLVVGVDRAAVRAPTAGRTAQ